MRNFKEHLWATGSILCILFFLLDLDTPVLISSKKISNITENDNVRFACQSKGNPPILAFEWYHNGLSVSNTSALSLPDVEIQDGGLYKCVVSNSKLKKESDIKFEVNCKY